MRIKAFTYRLVILLALATHTLHAQDVKVGARIDAAQITVGDRARLFIEAQHNAKTSKLQWATIPDTFNSLEIVEKGKIDTIVNGDLITYKQRLLITGFDSGLYVVPRFTFSILPVNGTVYTQQTDSFPILVQTVAVDTTQPFKGIKGIMYVKATWLDYIWYIIAAIVVLGLIIGYIIYSRRKKPAPVPTGPPPPTESVNAKALRLLNELEQKQLWQNSRPKEYHSELVDILRVYIEERFGINVMELTSDEILYKVAVHKEMSQHRLLLSNILHIADLAKFAKAQPTPQEHHAAMEYARQFINATQPVAVVPPQTTIQP